jgi:hypothetical protein
VAASCLAMTFGLHLFCPIPWRLLLSWFYSYDSRHAMASGSKGGESCASSLASGSFVLEPLYACTYLDHSISSVLAVTTAPLRTLGCLSAFRAPRSWYPTNSLGTHVLLRVAPSQCLASCHGLCVGRSRPLVLSSLPCSTLS